MKVKLTLLLFFSIFTSFSQNINGKVLEVETNTPIEYVNVYLKKIKEGSITNEKGEFHLKLQSNLKPTDTIHFSIIGYNTKYIIFSELEQLNFIVHLSKKTEHLDEVTVSNQVELKNQIPFKKLSSLKKGVYNFSSELIENKIYVIGGDQSYIEDTEKKVLHEVSNIPNATFGDFLKKMRSNFTWESYSDKLQIYDIAKNSWAISNLEFIKRAYHRTVYINDELYVLGGKSLSRNGKYEYLENRIEVLDLQKGKIIIDGTNPHQAINFSSFSYKDNIIIMGGSTKLKKSGEKIYSNESHIYDTSSGYWYELSKMTRAKEVSGIIVKNKIYLIGGFNKNPLTEIESYDLKNGQWKNEGNLFSGIENPALAYSDNCIYIFSSGLIQTYNTKTKILNEYKIALYTKSSQMHCYDGNLYIFGGYNEDEFTKSTSSMMSVIDLSDFRKTKIIKSTKFN
ncbi:kelch repeat-containing protein [Maribacter sp. Asnod1-A12]|uniref:Kelch repeat-containing protein n=1 Tax=Maribacter sp. Asnod1-A12 TaxID=3160576 RepID=UPI00386DC164